MNTTTNDKFPVLIRSGDYPNMVSCSGNLENIFRGFADRFLQLSASSAALDLATATNSSQPTSESSNYTSGTNAFNRHRPSQSQQIHSMTSMTSPSANGSSNGQVSVPESPISVRGSFRHSLDFKNHEQSYDGYDSGSLVASPTQGQTPPKLQSSYSANDVHTVRSIANGMSSAGGFPNTHAEQHLHHHNASLGRIPNGAQPTIRAREMPSPDTSSVQEISSGGYQSMTSVLHASAPPFGPSQMQGMPQTPPGAMASPTLSQGGYGGYYPPPYNPMQMMSLNMQNMSLNQMYPQHQPYAGYSPYPPPRLNDSQARVIQQRRQTDGEGMFVCSF